MTTPERIGFDKLVGAGRALLFSGLVGAVVGLITGLICGVFFFIFGAIFGAIWGTPTGFCVGVLASAIGGRRVWRITGILCGILGALLMVAGLGQNSSSQNPGDWCVELLVVAIAGVGGLIAGGVSDARLASGPGPNGMFCRLATRLEKADLGQLSLSVRLALALLELTPVLCLLGQLTKFAPYLAHPGFGL